MILFLFGLILTRKTTLHCLLKALVTHTCGENELRKNKSFKNRGKLWNLRSKKLLKSKYLIGPFF